MFSKIFALLALVAVAFAAPNPKPEPKPQYVAYSSGLDYVYPQTAVGVVSQVASPYSAPYPLAYSAYPAGAVYLR